jgi:chromosome segregation ATPase
LRRFALLSAGLACLSMASLCAVLTRQALLLPAKVGQDLQGRLDRSETELRAIRTDLAGTQAHLVSLLDRQLGQTNRSIAELARIRRDLQPVLHQTAAAVKDAQETLDDLYPDIRAAVESATVTTTAAAHTSEAIAAVAPETTRAASQVVVEAAGVTSDVHTFTTDLVKPQPWWKKLLKTIAGVVGIAGRIL